ncbi:MAG: hypothetical protein C0631_07535 [Sedimenticola sp.]|nr:MAG: hypothetical protein C0631_07535 [Sedimenticola sp.]
MRKTIQGGLRLSQEIEDLLVARNLRGMAKIKTVLQPGYCLRAAKLLSSCRGTVLIGTGFPVDNTFETDGPAGAISLYQALERIGVEPIIVCGAPVSHALINDYRVIELANGADAQKEGRHTAIETLEQFQPSLVISIERPGQAHDGGYYNMRGELISLNTACFDPFMELANCPTIAIGDGGNEIGMGNVHNALRDLNIVPAATLCDELIVADVSNWGGHALVALLGWLRQTDLLADFDNQGTLQYLSERGCVDGVTRLSTLTEDSLPATAGSGMISQLRHLTGFLSHDDLLQQMA